MADSEQSTESKETTAAEESEGVEDTAGAEPAGEEAIAAEAADAPAPEAAVAEETPAPEAEPEAEEPADAAATPAAETAPEPADEPAAEETAPEAAAPQHTYDELKGKTVAQMREIAEGLGEHDALHGYTTMHKEELLVALCAALGIEAHEHHDVVGIDKGDVKSRIRELKKQRDALVEARDAKQLKVVRARIRRLKRKIRKATV